MAVRPCARPQRRRLYCRCATRRNIKTARNIDMPGGARGQSPLPAKGVKTRRPSYLRAACSKSAPPGLPWKAPWGGAARSAGWLPVQALRRCHGAFQGNPFGAGRFCPIATSRALEISTYSCALPPCTGAKSAPSRWCGFAAPRSNLSKNVHYPAPLRIATKPVAAWCAVEAHEDEQREPPEERHEHQQQPPA